MAQKDGYVKCQVRMPSLIHLFHSSQYLIDPTDNYLANPMINLGRGAYSFLPLYPDDYDESVLPAFKYCPYYWTDLQPGDCLFNPPWWGHAIREVIQ